MRLSGLINMILGPLGYLLINKGFLTRKYGPAGETGFLHHLFYKKLHDDFFFVQIGANDGKSYDPIYEMVIKEHVKGIALEPLSDVYQKLTVNYTGYPNIRLLNKGIHRDKKESILYRVDPGAFHKYPAWVKGIASLNPEHHLLSNIDTADIIEERASFISWNELTDRYDIKSIDLLQIDTEGYDYEILMMIDVKEIAPEIIAFEHGLHQGIMNHEQLLDVQKKFLPADYNMIILHQDAILYRQ